jgi:hypothetical protein
VEATVAKIAFDVSGTCLGVETTTRDIFTSKHTILCTGARTAKPIAKSTPEKTKLQVNGKMAAAAAIMCAFTVPEISYISSRMPHHRQSNVIHTRLGKNSLISGIDSIDAGIVRYRYYYR